MDYNKIKKMILENEQRFFIYDFLVGDTVIIDNASDKMVFLKKNRINELCDISTYKIDEKAKAGLKDRLNSNYNWLMDYLIIDSYIYYHLFTEDDKKDCKRSAKINVNECIGSTSDLKSALLVAVKFMYNYNMENEKEIKGDYKTKLDKVLGEFIEQY